jgi:hypothetical protein
MLNHRRNFPLRCRITRVLHLHRHCHTESLRHCLGSILIVRSFVKGELQ